MNRPASHSLHRLVAIAMPLVFVVGCSSVPPPTEAMALARAAVDQAQASDAPELAPVELNEARAKLTRATQALDAKEYEQARRLAQGAEADAQLAQARARSAKSGKAVAELQESIRVLREELNRKSN